MKCNWLIFGVVIYFHCFVTITEATATGDVGGGGDGLVGDDASASAAGDISGTQASGSVVGGGTGNEPGDLDNSDGISDMPNVIQILRDYGIKPSVATAAAVALSNGAISFAFKVQDYEIWPPRARVGGPLLSLDDSTQSEQISGASLLSFDDSAAFQQVGPSRANDIDSGRTSGFSGFLHKHPRDGKDTRKFNDTSSHIDLLTGCAWDGECCKKNNDCCDDGQCEDVTCDTSLVAGCPNGYKGKCKVEDTCSAAVCEIVDCVSDTCVYTPVDCDDSKTCTLESCCTAQSCGPVSQGECVFSPLDCDDGDACTIDECIEPSGCANTPMDCDDSDDCTNDTCNAGTCEHPLIECEHGTCTNGECPSAAPIAGMIDAFIGHFSFTDTFLSADVNTNNNNPYLYVQTAAEPDADIIGLNRKVTLYIEQDNTGPYPSINFYPWNAFNADANAWMKYHYEYDGNGAGLAYKPLDDTYFQCDTATHISPANKYIVVEYSQDQGGVLYATLPTAYNIVVSLSDGSNTWTLSKKPPHDFEVVVPGVYWLITYLDEDNDATNNVNVVVHFKISDFSASITSSTTITSIKVEFNLWSTDLVDTLPNEGNIKQYSTKCCIDDTDCLSGKTCDRGPASGFTYMCV